jgi:hypothetical protein
MDVCISIGYYWVFAVNLNDKCVFILDPTPGSADKGEQLKCYSRTLKQIEENIIKIMRLKHPHYEVKHSYDCIVDNIRSSSR